MRISDWSSDVCSSDLGQKHAALRLRPLIRPSGTFSRRREKGWFSGALLLRSGVKVCCLRAIGSRTPERPARCAGPGRGARWRGAPDEGASGASCFCRGRGFRRSYVDGSGCLSGSRASMASARISPVTGLRRKPSKPAAVAWGSASGSARAVTASRGAGWGGRGGVRGLPGGRLPPFLGGWVGVVVGRVGLDGFGGDVARDGFAQEAVEAGGGGLGFGIGVGTGGDGQQGGGEAAGAQLAGQGETVEAGQVEVEQGKVEAGGGGFGKRGQAVRGVDDCVALGAQQAGDHFGDRKSTRLNSSHSCAYRMPSYA